MTDPATVDVRDARLEELIDPEAQLEVIADGLDFCEGPVWSEPDGFLLFTDIAMNTIRRWDPAGGLSVFRDPSNKANGLTRDNAGRLLACEHVSSTVSRTDQEGNISAVASHWEGKELNSPNDVVAARNGAVYFTDPPDGRVSDRWGLLREREIDFQGVYVVPPGAGPEETVLIADDFAFPNGVWLSADERTLYANDTTHNHVRAFDVNADGSVTGGGVFLEQPGGDLTIGAPDGMACDIHGNLWATGPHGVWVVTPDAEVLGVVRTPGFASNVTFGGSGWTDVFITGPGIVWRVPTRTRAARSAHVVQAELRQVADDVLAKLSPGRVTIRLEDAPSTSFQVKAEACAEGVASIAAHHTEGIRESGTFVFLDEERRPLVQEDVMTGPKPAPVLYEVYGAFAQILTPVIVDGEIRSLLSIHSPVKRQWDEGEVAEAERAASEIARIIST
jgi:gluconolactonase